MKYTQGPWTFHRGNHGWGVDKSVSHGIRTIHDNTDGTRREEHEANAKLIAAAPDLLKACKDVLAALEKSTEATGEILWLDHVLPGVHESAMERLKNVIAQAEGQPVSDIG